MISAVKEMSHDGARLQTLRRSSHVSAKRDRCEGSKWCRTLRAQHGESLSAVREKRQTRQRGVCGYGRACVRCRYSSRPRSPRRSQANPSRVRLQTCLRSDRARLVLHVGSSRWLVPGPARAAAAREHENRRICQRAPSTLWRR